MRQDKSKKQNFEEIVTENFINLRKYKAKKKRKKKTTKLQIQESYHIPKK